MWTERIPGRGEDAEPFVAHHFGTQQGMLAVFDGSGGAGSSPAWQAPDGETRTGAWVGSRVARLAADCWFHDVVEGGQADTPEQLTQYLKYFLSKAPQRRSKIVGTMRRRLPTTLAAVQYQMHEDRSIEWQALWAGDSRAYTLQPGAGLRVLTRDHTHESDALELLRSDPPMTNSICADRDFVVEVQRMSFQLPCVFLAATDGFFGYVHTPAEFEYVLLSTLMQANNEHEWADLIRREVQGYTADDASMALIALGYQDVTHLRDAFEDRYVTVRERYARGRPQGTDQTERIRGWQDETWRTYRAAYETFLPPLPEEQA
ncbi:PP2C family protein-serine/threonine phosphatase [Streptomyces sp. NPDC048434]|uniref:PP2C family protein-serine/threonine phosphatase n=1 Tax=Streptomyces sp. NPDC048434 TaxID=3365549 RepID=UPI003719E558